MRRYRDLIIGAVLVVALVAAGYFFAIRPEAAAVRTQQAALASAQASIAATQAQVQGLDTLKAQAPGMQRQLGQLATLVPSTPQLPNLLLSLRAAAAQSGVQLTSIAPGVPAYAAASGAPSAQPSVAVISTKVAATGSYFQVRDFLAQLENLSTAPVGSTLPARAVIVTSASLSQGASGSGSSSVSTTGGAQPTGQLTATLTVEAFESATAAALPAGLSGQAAGSTAPGAVAAG